jgi:energy-coupling factor transporter ATP-binding protein EcfA2
MPLYDLTGDPFAGIIVTKEKALKNELTVKTRSIRELEDIFIYGFAFDAPKHYILLGGSGVGKSTALSHLKRYIQDNAPKDSYKRTFTGRVLYVPGTQGRIWREGPGQGATPHYGRYDWTKMAGCPQAVAGATDLLFGIFRQDSQAGACQGALQGRRELIRQDGVHVSSMTRTTTT